MLGKLLLRISAVLAFLLLCFGHAPPGVSQSTGATQTAETWQLEGVVVSATTGLPLRKISLQLFPRRAFTRVRAGTPGQFIRPYYAVSDDSGHFSFSFAVPGEYALDANGRGYPFQRYGQSAQFPGGTPFKLEPGKHVTIHFALQPGAVITGQVTDEDGDPVERAQLVALRKGSFDGRARLEPRGSAQTDDRGDYRIFELPAGRYYVYANTPERRPIAGANAQGRISLPDFYPSSADPNSATVLTARPGDILSGIDISLTTVAPAHISGQVLGGAGGLAFGIMLQRKDPALRGAGSPFRTFRRDASGHFEIGGIPPGSYILIAYGRAGETNLYGQLPLDLSEGESLDGVQLTLAPPVQFSGVLTADPSPGLELSSILVSLHPLGSDPSGQTRVARVRQDGTFIMRNVSPGSYRVRVNAPSAYYLKSASMNGVDVLASGLTLVSGIPPGPLGLNLSLDGGSVTGTVNDDGKPDANARVVLIPDAPKRDRDSLYKASGTDSAGSFTFQGIAPGDYKLFAWEDDNEYDYRDADFMSAAGNLGQDIEVRPRSTQQVQLQLIPASELPQQ